MVPGEEGAFSAMDGLTVSQFRKQKIEALAGSLPRAMPSHKLWKLEI